jgi:hypothetical protein
MTITQADRWGWQYQAARELCTILLAHRDLPVIPWTISGSGGTLAGRISGQAPAGQVRYLFCAWRTALGLTEGAERDGGSGITYLHAGAYRRGVSVRLVATVRLRDDHDGCTDEAVTW